MVVMVELVSILIEEGRLVETRMTIVIREKLHVLVVSLARDCYASLLLIFDVKKCNITLLILAPRSGLAAKFGIDVGGMIRTRSSLAFCSTNFIMFSIH